MPRQVLRQLHGARHALLKSAVRDWRWMDAGVGANVRVALDYDRMQVTLYLMSGPGAGSDRIEGLWALQSRSGGLSPDLGGGATMAGRAREGDMY